VHATRLPTTLASTWSRRGRQSWRRRASRGRQQRQSRRINPPSGVSSLPWPAHTSSLAGPPAAGTAATNGRRVTGAKHRAQNW